MIKRFLYSVLLFSILFVYSNTFGQNNVNDIDTHEKSEHFHFNHLGIFIGATSSLEKKSTNFTLGADYVRRFSSTSPWGIGFIGEAIFAEHTEWVFGIPAYYYVEDIIWIRSGPGIEILKEESGHSLDTKIEFLYRIGLGHDFELGKFTITPSVDLDLVHHHNSVVWGVSIGKGF